MSLVPKFHSMASCKANSGIFFAFWNDQWDLAVVKLKFPQLHSFARKKNYSLNQFLVWDESMSLFYLFFYLCRLLLITSSFSSNLILKTSTQKLFSRMFGIILGVRIYSLVTRLIVNGKDLTQLLFYSNGCGNHVCKTNKSSSSGCFLGQNQHSEFIASKNMFLHSYSCVLCVENVEEDIRHLFFTCPFSDACQTVLWDLALPFEAMVLQVRLWFNLAIVDFHRSIHNWLLVHLSVIRMALSLMLFLCLSLVGEIFSLKSC